MKPHAGDRIVVESEKVAKPSRAGEIEEVLQEDPCASASAGRTGTPASWRRLLAPRALLRGRPELKA
jgi:hypothetical protein